MLLMIVSRRPIPRIRNSQDNTPANQASRHPRRLLRTGVPLYAERTRHIHAIQNQIMFLGFSQKSFTPSKSFPFCSVKGGSAGRSIRRRLPFCVKPRTVQSGHPTRGCIPRCFPLRGAPQHGKTMNLVMEQFPQLLPGDPARHGNETVADTDTAGNNARAAVPSLWPPTHPGSGSGPMSPAPRSWGYGLGVKGERSGDRR